MEINEDSLKMITALADSFGPSGFEDEVANTARKFTGDFATDEDNIRNFYITPKNNRGGRPTVMLDAHSDEVGFMIHSIKNDGTLRFVALGNPSVASLPSARVQVLNGRGKLLPGVISAVPPHYLKKGEKQDTDISHLSIDIGATSREEAEEVFGIEIGLPAAPFSPCITDRDNGLIFGKGFDCRIGCAALIETMKRLADEDLRVDIAGVLSSQEEVGGRGASVAVNRICPDVAICFEGCPADDTVVETDMQQTKMKHGPMLRFVDVSMITNPRFQRLALNKAKQCGIKAQGGVREGGGTNGGVVHCLQHGIPAIVIGVPVRYIHCPNCVTAYEDFESAVSLACEVIKALNADVIAGF